MVMKMNDFLDKLSKRTKYSEEQCSTIQKILEKHKIVGRKNKDRIISNFIQILQIDNIKANELYNICMEIKLKEILS